MSKNKIKEELAQIKAFRRATSQFNKLWNKWKLEIDDRVQFQMEVADALEGDDDMVEQVARRGTFGLRRNTQVGPQLLDCLEQTSKWMAESADKLALLVKKAREQKAG